MNDNTDAMSAADRRYSSRKFVLAAATLLAVWAGRVLGLLTPELAVDATKWTLGLYFAGNVGASAVAALGGKAAA